MNFKGILNKIENNDSIVIFRHTRADYDAIGSQLGLKHLLKLNYPDKKVFCYGKDWMDNEEFVERMDEVSEETIKESLAIVLDCSTNERIEDEKFALAKDKVKIDHHNHSQYLSDADYVDEKASSTCILIAKMIKEEALKCDKSVATYLMAGLLTDTMGLTTNSVSAVDFEMAAYLMSYGLDINYIHRQIFSDDIKVFKANNEVGKMFEFYKDKAWAIITNEDYKRFGIEPFDAKNMIDLVRNVKGVNCWALFYQIEDGSYKASLRSHQIPIVQIANKYDGGGHNCAAGISNLNPDTIKEVIELLKEVH